MDRLEDIKSLVANWRKDSGWKDDIHWLIAEVERLRVMFKEAFNTLQCVLLEERMPNGEYVHLLTCSGSRDYPAGTSGHSCSCRVGRASKEALRRVVEALEKSRDTHDDFEIAMKVLQRHSFAEAAKIARDHCNEALAFAKGVMGE